MTDSANPKLSKCTAPPSNRTRPRQLDEYGRRRDEREESTSSLMSSSSSSPRRDDDARDEEDPNGDPTKLPSSSPLPHTRAGSDGSAWNLHREQVTIEKSPEEVGQGTRKPQSIESTTAGKPQGDVGIVASQGNLATCRSEGRLGRHKANPVRSTGSTVSSLATFRSSSSAASSLSSSSSSGSGDHSQLASSASDPNLEGRVYQQDSLTIETNLQGLGLGGVGIGSGDKGCLELEISGAEGDGTKTGGARCETGLKAPGTFRDGYFDDGEDTDESWLYYSASSRRYDGKGAGCSSPKEGESEREVERSIEARDLNAETSSTPLQHSSSTSNSSPSQIASQPPTQSSNSFGSPLSPHVPPFSPGLIGIRQFNSSTANIEEPSDPWATPSSFVLGTSRIAGAREREASWASIAFESGATFPSPSLRSTLGAALAGGSHASSNASYSPFASPPPSLYRTDLSSDSSPAFPHSSTMPFTPPSSHGESFEAHQAVPAKENVVVPFRYVRAPYTIQPQTSSTTLNGNSTQSAGGAENLSTPTAQEEVSTLFVFGFPEDMMEREFQNLFMFAPGFEAAALKVPHPSFGEGLDVATGTSGGANLGGGGQRGSIDEYDPRTVNPNGTGGGTSSSNVSPGKRQKIGFAKFLTKRDALDAMEILNRKRVDQEKGLVLRADMAKKNLHVRRSNVNLANFSTGVHSQYEPGVDPGPSGLPQTDSSILLPPSGPAATSSSSSSSTSNEAAIAAALQGPGPSIPLSLLDQETLQSLANSGTTNPAVLAEIARQRATSVSTSSSTTSKAGMSAYDAFHSVPSLNATSIDRQAYLAGGHTAVPLQQEDQTAGYQSREISAQSLARHSSLNGRGDQQQIGEYSRSSSMSALQPSPYLSTENGFANTMTTTPRVPFPSQPGSSLPQQQQQVQPQQAAPYNYRGPPPLVPAVVRPQTLAQQQVSSQIAAQHQAQLAAAQAYARTLNPADMNAPKNTLYVGGLPAILPSLTGPFSASHLEDSLRNAFSRCPGFKRLQFRSKSNGPIVFVEFEDTAYATRAMNEMYGYTLGGLVKGGIRLSYSKNPLGVRSNGLPSGNPPPLPSSLVTHAPIDHSRSNVVYPAYAVSYAAPPASLVEVQRRQPEAFYANSPYTTPNLPARGSLSTSLEQHQHLHKTSSSISAIGTPAHTTASSPTPQVPPGSTFSPFFSAEY